MVVISLDNISTEILINIFKFLTIPELCKLRLTCKRFNEIIDTWGNCIVKVQPLITNHQDSEVNNRSLRQLSLFDRLRISRNWCLGVYSEKAILGCRTKCIPWLQLERDFLWLSKEGYIQAHKRSRKGVNTKATYTISSNTKAEVSHFVKKDNHILSGQTDGSVWLWCADDQKFIFQKEKCHMADINAVDMLNNIFVTGSSDNCVKIWDKDKRSDCHTLEFCERIWSLALSDRFLAIGTAGVMSPTAISIFDMNNQQFAAKFYSIEIGAGVLDLKWESPHTLWAGGYDACLRRWDMRTGACVQTLSDPCGSTVYCFQFDHCNSMVSGTQDNGRVVLWDTRQNNYAQMYYLECCRDLRRTSPIYALSYDVEFLFAATDRHLTILDFSVLKGKFRDYNSYLFYYRQ